MADFPRMTLTPLFRVFLVCFAAALAGASPRVEGEEVLRLAVYFPDYRHDEGYRPTLYGTTDLILFSATPRDDGSVDFSRITPGLLAMGRQAREESGARVTVCVGGWGRGKLFANAVSTAGNRARFVEALGAFCRENDLDGVDIDWEFPRGEREHADFTAFLQALSGVLRAESRVLTVALSPAHPLSPEAYAVIDQVNLMSYQPWNPAPYETWLEDSVRAILDSGVPPGKVNIGLPFFTKELGGERRALSWKKLVGPGRVSVPESEHGYSPVGTSIIDLRLELVERFGLGGVMVWEYGHDSREPRDSLLRYLSAGLAGEE